MGKLLARFWFGRESAYRSNVLLIVVTFFAFLPCLLAGFLNWDDPTHLLENPLLPFRHFADIGKVFFTAGSVSDTYMPLTIISFGMERWLCGLNPFFFHLDNILLHILMVVLVRTLALRLGLSERAALVAALIFAVHPMRVESVAWVTERKDVLYGVFYVVTMILYIDYIRNNRGRTYILALVCALAGILAKPMAFSLPLILFLLDWQDRRRWSWKVIGDKLPFVLTIWPVTMVTVMMMARPLQQQTADVILVPAFTFAFYVTHFFWPVGLATIYSVPRPVGWHHPDYVMAVVEVGIILSAVWFFRRNRWVVFAFLFYILSIFVNLQIDLFRGSIGIVQERYLYVAGIGFVLLLGSVWDGFFFQNTGRGTWRVALGWWLAALLCTALALVTFNRCFVWQDSLTYWTSVLRGDPNNTFALVNRSACLLEDAEIARRYGLSDAVRYAIALHDLQLAVRRAPRDPEIWNNLGIVLDRLGRKAEADAAFAKVGRLGGLERK